MAGSLGPAPEEANGILEAVEGAHPAVSITAHRWGGRLDQSDPSRLGALLRRRSFGPVLWLCSGLGGEEGEASLDAGTEAPRVRLEEVECAVAVRHAGPVGDYRVYRRKQLRLKALPA